MKIETRQKYFDTVSKVFKVALTCAAIWVLIASFLAFDLYQNYKPNELSVVSSRCFEKRVDFSFNTQAQPISPTQSEIQSCLDREEDVRAASDRRAMDDALKWFAYWGLAASALLLAFVSLRQGIADITKAAWLGYSRWLNSDTTPTG